MDDSGLRPSPFGSPLAAISPRRPPLRVEPKGSNPLYLRTNNKGRFTPNFAAFYMVEGGGFEPPKLARQIYSLIPLATREPLQEGAHSHYAPLGCQPLYGGKLQQLTHSWVRSQA